MTAQSCPSSRIIVKNLPKWASEERLRKHFGSKGQITDIKMMYTRSGIFRRFAYIGFASADEAQAAIRYFDRTFIDTARIEADFALPVTSGLCIFLTLFQASSADLSRPWSKYSVGSSANEKHLKKVSTKAQAQVKEKSEKKTSEETDKVRVELERKKKILQSIYEDDAEGEQLRSFVNVMKPASKTKLWENDGDKSVLPDDRKKTPAGKVKLTSVPNRKPGGAGQLLTKVHVTFDENNSDDADGECKKDRVPKGDSGEESDDLYEDFVQPDLGSSVSLLDDGATDCRLKEPADPEWEGRDRGGTGAEDGEDDEPCSEQEDAKADVSPDMIAENGRLFVRNLSYSCTEEDLKRLFEPFGILAELHLPISKEIKKPKGFAYVTFVFPEHALRAYTKLDGVIFQGRLLHILPAQDKPAPKAAPEEGGSGAPGSFQSKKIQEQKAHAQQDFNWNTLFIRSDTVLDAISAKLGVAKSAIMDVQSDNLATRLAVAETNLIQETKSYLEEEGVVLDAFVLGYQRSDTIMLVKNLSFNTEVSELRKMFEKFGTLGRVLLPPTKTVALIEFFEPSEARAAFRSLAYTKFKHAPLFLEWAPVKSLKPREKIETAPQASVVKIAEAAEGENDVFSTPSEACTTLYVKNLNFSTTSDTIKAVFSTVGPVRSVKIATKKTGDGYLSLGFGFVEFESKESVNRALDELQNHIVDGHALLLKRSVQKSDPAPSTGKRKGPSVERPEQNDKNTKLVVRNVPFETNEKEIRELFKTFAQLKRVRLPRRFDGRHRGFGFVEFLTHQEALNAKTALAHTHLYGRHLVLEWAKPESEGSAEDDFAGERQIEGLREKTRSKMNLSTPRPQSHKKMHIGAAEDKLGSEAVSDPDDDD